MIESFEESQKVLAGSDRSQIVLRGFRSFKRGQHILKTLTNPKSSNSTNNKSPASLYALHSFVVFSLPGLSTRRKVIPGPGLSPPSQKA